MRPWSFSGSASEMFTFVFVYSISNNLVSLYIYFWNLYSSYQLTMTEDLTEEADVVSVGNYKLCKSYNSYLVLYFFILIYKT